MSTREKAHWHLAVKVFLRKNNELLILKDIYDDGWDLPGGRLRKCDIETPFADVIDLKLQEEIGPTVSYKVATNPCVFFRHTRLEVETQAKVHIFALGYEANYITGDILLGSYMSEYKWIHINDLTPKDYFRGGWLQGVEDYIQQQK